MAPWLEHKLVGIDRETTREHGTVDLPLVAWQNNYLHLLDLLVDIQHQIKTRYIGIALFPGLSEGLDRLPFLENTRRSQHTVNVLIG